MQGLKEMLTGIRRVTPKKDGFQYFFGYYDLPAFHPGGALHLCHRTRFMDRLPEPGDGCDLGVVDLASGEFRAFAQTGAWNFQQGAMLQWNTPNTSEAIYNIWDGSAYRGMVQDIDTGRSHQLDYPVANVSPDGRYGLSINFDRMYDFRPGYGYCNRTDPWVAEACPSDDGVTLVDMESGKGRLLFSLRDLDAMFGKDRPKGQKLVINHITFNPASNRFLFLVRNFPGKDGGWLTGIGTSDLGGNVYVLRDFTYASHYFWRDEKTVLIYADCGEGSGLYELTDQTQDYHLYSQEFFREDIHCTYSPDQQWILGDGYADREEYRSLLLYHIPTDQGTCLGKFYAPALSSFDIRSDLHCRWSPGGDRISFDSIHEGFRGVYTMEIGEVLASLQKEYIQGKVRI